MSLIETEGVDIIPESQRSRGFWSIFAIWAGFSIVITNFLLGSVTVAAGVTAGFAAAIISIVLVGVVVYLGTQIAAKEGAAGTTAMRAPFGINGRAIPSLGIIFAGVGWFGVQTGLVAESTQLILEDFGVELPFIALALVLGLLMASVAVVGYRWIEWLNRLAVPVMSILIALVVYQIWTTYGIDFSAEGSGDMTFWAALNVFPAAMAAALIVAMDYGRYGSNEDASGAALGSSLAWIGFAGVLGVVGILAASVAGTWNPVEIMVELGLGSVGLLLLILGSWTTNVTNVYVGGIGLSQLTGARRLYMTALAGVIGTAFAMGGIFSMGGILGFLEGLTITLVPTTGILLVHYYVIEGGLDHDALFDPSGKYAYLRGWNPAAVVAWAIAAAYAVYAPEWVVPALSSIVIAGVIYYAMRSPTDNWLAGRTGEQVAAD